MPKEQQLLLPDLVNNQDLELLSAEHEALQSCPQLVSLTPEQVRFCVVYVLCDPKKVSMDQLAELAGTSRRQAYRWLNEPVVRMAMTAIAQRMCDTGLTKLAGAVAILADRLAGDLISGMKTKLEPCEQWLAQVALRRAGVDVGGGSRTLSAKLSDGTGRTAEFSITDSDPGLDAQLKAVVSELRAKTRGTVCASPEAAGRHSVPGIEGDPEGGAEFAGSGEEAAR